MFWLYNLHYRHRTLSQGKIFLQQNTDVANMTIAELKEHVAKPVAFNPVLAKMTRYMANVPGTPAYWHRSSQDLSALIASNGLPTAFFTLTLADFHCPHLYAFLGIAPESTTARVKEILKANPQRVNWFFVQKFNEFKTRFLEEFLKCHPK